MPATTYEGPSCPKCDGAMWDNRFSKRNPKQPDYKCRNRACDGVIWPAKNGAAQTPTVVNNPGNGAALTHNAMVTEKLNELQQSYDLFFRHAIDLAMGAQKTIGPDFVVTLEGLSAVTATLLIASREKGLV